MAVVDDLFLILPCNKAIAKAWFSGKLSGGFNTDAEFLRMLLEYCFETPNLDEDSSFNEELPNSIETLFDYNSAVAIELTDSLFGDQFAEKLQENHKLKQLEDFKELEEELEIPNKAEDTKNNSEAGAEPNDVIIKEEPLEESDLRNIPSFESVGINDFCSAQLNENSTEIPLAAAPLQTNQSYGTIPFIVSGVTNYLITSPVTTPFQNPIIYGTAFLLPKPSGQTATNSQSNMPSVTSSDSVSSSAAAESTRVNPSSKNACLKAILSKAKPEACPTKPKSVTIAARKNFLLNLEDDPDSSDADHKEEKDDTKTEIKARERPPYVCCGIEFYTKHSFNYHQKNQCEEIEKTENEPKDEKADDEFKFDRKESPIKYRGAKGSYHHFKPSSSGECEEKPKSSQDIDCKKEMVASKVKPGSASKTNKRSQCGLCGSHVIDLNKHHGVCFEHNCIQCGKSFKKKDELASHLKEHSLDALVCTYCSLPFRTRASLKEHEDEHRSNNDAKPSCAEESKDDTTDAKPVEKSKEKPKTLKDKKRNYKKEMQNAAGICYICGRMAKSISIHMYRHTLKKQNQTKVECKLCGQFYKGTNRLALHQKVIHVAERTHICAICGKAFKTGAMLKKHNKVHTGERPYSCSFCEKRFNCPYNLQQHENVHKGIKPYKCEFCSKDFSQRAALIQHTRQHTGIKVTDAFQQKVAEREKLLNKSPAPQDQKTVSPVIVDLKGQKVKKKTNRYFLKRNLMNTTF